MVEVGVGVAGGGGDGDFAGDFATVVGVVVEGIAKGDCLAGQLYDGAGLMVFLETRRCAEGCPQPRYGLKRGARLSCRG